jgi:hypothetical protein
MIWEGRGAVSPSFEVMSYGLPSTDENNKNLRLTSLEANI